MLPFRIVSQAINNNEYYRTFTQNHFLMNWGWLISFVLISVFNGWIIKLSPIELSLKKIIVIYFALFPLAAIGLNFVKSTWLLITNLIVTRSLLALALCYINLTELNQIPISLLIGLLGLHILLFSTVLIFVAKTRGVLVPIFISFFILTLTMVGSFRWAFSLIWYCNLVVTFNKTGRQLRHTLDNFDAAMLSISGITAVALSFGWIMGDLLK